MPAPQLPPDWGKVNMPALRERINAGLRAVEHVRSLRHFRVTREGTDIAVTCWCSKSRSLDTRHINLFCERFEQFLEEHSLCEPETNA